MEDKRWMKYNKDIPKKYALESVILCIEIGSKQYKVVHAIPYYDERGDMCFKDCSGEKIYRKIKYWMPFPEIPKQLCKKN
jgi:hypothetical protein